MNAEELQRFIADYTEDVWNQRRCDVDAINRTMPRPTSITTRRGWT